jgi:GntR family transcriptional regulator
MNDADPMPVRGAVPLYHQIFLALREEILTGSRPFGSRLPTEEELAANAGVSRITARRALAELAETNLVERRRRLGTHVVHRSPARPIEASLEQAMDTLLTYGRRTAVRLLERAVVPARAPLAEALGVVEGTSLLRAVRLRSLDGQPISHLVSHVPLDLAGAMSEAALERTPMLELLEQAGARIGGATQTITAALADAPLAAALEIAIGAAVLRVTRTVFDAEERPIQHVQAQFRPDLYQIRLDLHSARG